MPEEDRIVPSLAVLFEADPRVKDDLLALGVDTQNMVLLLVSLHLAELVLALLHAEEKEDAVDRVRVLTLELAAADDQVAALGLLEELLLTDAEKGPEFEALFYADF